MQRSFPPCKRRFQQVRGVHRPASWSRTGADHRVDLVDEQDGIRMLFQFRYHRFQPFFESRRGTACRPARRPYPANRWWTPCRTSGVALFNDLLGQTFRDRGFAHTRIAHQKRVVLAAAAQNLHAALNLMVAPDQWINVAFFDDFAFRSTQYLASALSLASSSAVSALDGRRFFVELGRARHRARVSPKDGSLATPWAM